MAAVRFPGGPPFSFVDEAHADRGEGPSERVVQPPPRHLEIAHARRKRRADPPRRRAAAQDHARGVPERDLERQAGRVRAVGTPSVQDRERRRFRADRGARLERAGNRLPAENRAPEDPVRAEPRDQTPSPRAARERAQRPSSPRGAFVRQEVQPLDPQSQGHRTRRALAYLQTRGGLARAGTCGHDVVHPAREAGAPQRGVQLGVGEAVGIVEGGAAQARAPALIFLSLEGEPGSVRRGAPERQGTPVAQLEGGARRRGEERAQEKKRRERSRRPHRSTTVSARAPWRAGSVPSGIVSARAT